MASPARVYPTNRIIITPIDHIQAFMRTIAEHKTWLI